LDTKHNTTKTSGTASTASSTSKTSAKKTTPTVATKQYVNDEYGFSFAYPANWKLTTNLTNTGGAHNEGTVIVESPAGTKVHFDPNQGGKGGDCIPNSSDTPDHTQNCNTVTILSLEKLPNGSNTQPVYFYTAKFTSSIANGSKQQYSAYVGSGSSAPTATGATIGSGFLNYDQVIVPKITAGYVTNYVEEPDDTVPGFLTSAAVKEATPILKSFRLN